MVTMPVERKMAAASHKCGNDCSEPERNMVNIFQFLSVFSAVLESDHWADADGESQIKGLE